MKKVIIYLYVLFPCFLFGQELNAQWEKRVESIIDSTDTKNMVLIQAFEVGAHIDKVWEAYTTENGWESWAVPIAEFDFKINGTISTTYDKNGKIGDPGTIRLHIINYVPRKMLTLQAELTENFPDFMKEDSQNLYNVILFDEISPTSTIVTSYGIGYKNNEKYMGLMKFFISGNEQSYLQLISYLETGQPVKF